MKDYTATTPDISFSSLENQPNVIKSNAKNQIIYSWIFSILWNAFVFTFIFLVQENLLKMADESPLFYVFILFPLIGIYTLYAVIKDSIAWFTFGKAPLTLSSFPPKTGEKINGYVDINTKHGRSKQATVSLSCRRHYWRKSHNESEKTMDVVWQDDISAQAKPSLKGSRLEFSFQPPADLPETQKKSDDYHEWNITVELPLKGSDFERKYIIPVSKGDASKNSADKIHQVVHKQHSFDQTDITAKTVPQVSKSIDGKSFHYPPSQHRAFGIGFIISSFIVGVVLYLMYQVFSEVIPLSSIFFFSFAAIAPVALFFAGLLALGHKLTVDVSLQGLIIEHRLLFYPYIDKLKTSDIADITVKKSGSSSTNGQTTKVWYQLKAVEKNGLETTVGDGIEGHSYAEVIRQEMIDELGSGWKPSEVTHSSEPLKSSKIDKAKKVAKILSKVVPLVGLALLAYDLKNSLPGFLE